MTHINCEQVHSTMTGKKNSKNYKLGSPKQTYAVISLRDGLRSQYLGAILYVLPSLEHVKHVKFLTKKCSIHHSI